MPPKSSRRRCLSAAEVFVQCYLCTGLPVLHYAQVLEQRVFHRKLILVDRNVLLFLYGDMHATVLLSAVHLLSRLTTAMAQIRLTAVYPSAGAGKWMTQRCVIAGA